jgi:hypothetical protein
MPSSYRPRTLVAGISKNAFLNWLNSARSGKSITYFGGHNLGDADESTQETALAARESFARGEIELIQARDDDNKISYLAIKRHETREPRVHGAKWLPQIDWQARVYYR